MKLNFPLSTVGQIHWVISSIRMDIFIQKKLKLTINLEVYLNIILKALLKVEETNKNRLVLVGIVGEKERRNPDNQKNFTLTWFVINILKWCFWHSQYLINWIFSLSLLWQCLYHLGPVSITEGVWHIQI